MNVAASEKREPPSRTLARLLRAPIDEGTLGPGARLPSERELASEHGVARNTAREAIRLLAEQGLVTAEHGRGVFVRSRAPLMRFGQSRYSQKLRNETGLSPYRAEVQAQAREPSVDCRSVDRVPAPDFVSDRLGLPPGEAVVRRENWYYADGEAMQIGVTWSAWSIVKDSPIGKSAQLGSGSIYARFEELGHNIRSIREEVTARTPTPTETGDLALPSGVPVLDVIHTGLDQHGDPFEVTRFIMRADRNALDYRMPVEEA